MKELIIVRHGKSSWEYEVSDKDRPLRQRGIRDAHRVARVYKDSMPSIDAVFSSPANRALHTCIIFLRELDIPFDKLQVTDALYDFSGESVMHFVNSFPSDYQRVMIFGHNFAFTNVANQWGDKRIDNVPTSGLVHLRSEATEWHQMERATTVQTLFPKELR